MSKINYYASLLIAALLFFAPIASAEVTNLRIEDITETEAVMRFDISPVVDVLVEIKLYEGQYQALSKTGEYASHNYKIHAQIALLPGSEYTVRITPAGGKPSTIPFTTAGGEVSIDEPESEPKQLKYIMQVVTDSANGCHWARIVPSDVKSKSELLHWIIPFAPRVNSDGSIMGCNK